MTLLLWRRHNTSAMVSPMVVLRYRSPGAGADPIQKYLDKLPGAEAATLADALAGIADDGLASVSTRQLRGRLWEIKLGAHRFAYVLLSGERLVLLHAWRKAGQKAPKTDLETALGRMKEILDWE